MIPILAAFLSSLISLVASQNSKLQSDAYNTFISHQDRLWEHLFKDYDPKKNALYTLRSSNFLDQNTTVHPETTTLLLTMSMLKLIDVVEVEEKVTFLFDYTADWNDPRLTWNPLDYGGIDHTYVPQESIWMPEITIGDAHEVKVFTTDDGPRRAWLFYNGSVGFYTATVASVICELDVFDFPMDEHECGVSVLYHTYYPNEFRIQGGMTEIAKPMEKLGNGEWQVTYVGVTEEPVANWAPTQRFIARIRRNPGFYVSLVMVPAFFINFLTILALFINVENVGEKLNVGLTNIMAMTFILVILAADLPKTARIPLLAIYVIVGLVIVMCSIAVVLAIPFLRKSPEKTIKKTKDSADPTRLQRFWAWLKVEYVLMVVFQIANLINFVILFV